MREPVKPNDEDCCNSGCNPCIFDVYEQQVRRYEAFINGSEELDTITENAISQLEYNSFIVKQNIDLNNDHNLILFVNHSSENKVIWNSGDHFLVKYSSPELNCSRAYTPIKLESDDKNYDFGIIVKRCGVVSNYLCDLRIGDTSLWRGPYGHFKISPCFDRIIMIAQGTGIAPFYSIIKHILKDEENMTRLILLYCCKGVKSILLRNDLYSLKSYWNFNYKIYVNGTAESLKYQEPIITHRFNSEDLFKYVPFSEKDQFLICGSSAFMEEYSCLLSGKNIDKANIVKF